MKGKIINYFLFFILCLYCFTSCNDAKDNYSPKTDSITISSPDSVKVDTPNVKVDSALKIPDNGIAKIKKTQKPDSAIKNDITSKDSAAALIDLSSLTKDGIVIWTLPEKMKTYVQSLVKVRIATYINKLGALKDIDTTKSNSGSSEIDVSKKMKVTLVSGKDSDFIIVAKDSIHTIPDKNYAEWLWTVTPLKAGTKFLILKVSQIEINDGKERVLEDKNVFSKEFKVKVSFAYVTTQTWNFIKANWIIISAIITFFTGLVVRKKINDGNKNKPDPQT